MVRIYQKTIRDGEVRELDEFKVGSWINVEAPSDQELDSLVAQFGLEKGHLKDALDPFEVPRLEIEGETIYIFTRIPRQNRGKITTFPMLVILGGDFLMTVSGQPHSFLEKFISGKISDFHTTQKVKVFVQVFSEINAVYNNFLADINRRVRNVSANLRDINNESIIQLVEFESDLNDFLAGLVPTNNILNNILSGRFVKTFEQDKDMIEDLFLGNGQLIEFCRSTLKTIVNTREAYSAITANNLNRVIKILTSLTILVTVPTMISSFYGMNVRLPFGDSPLAFAGILGVTLFALGGLMWVFVRNDWL